jgi:hypothetical protein
MPDPVSSAKRIYASSLGGALELRDKMETRKRDLDQIRELCGDAVDEERLAELESFMTQVVEVASPQVAAYFQLQRLPKARVVYKLRPRRGRSRRRTSNARCRGSRRTGAGSRAGPDDPDGDPDPPGFRTPRARRDNKAGWAR